MPDLSIVGFAGAAVMAFVEVGLWSQRCQGRPMGAGIEKSGSTKWAESGPSMPGKKKWHWDRPSGAVHRWVRVIGSRSRDACLSRFSIIACVYLQSPGGGQKRVAGLCTGMPRGLSRL